MLYYIHYVHLSCRLLKALVYSTGADIHCMKGAWQRKTRGAGDNGLFATINADCLIFCYEDIIEGLGVGFKLPNFPPPPPPPPL